MVRNSRRQTCLQLLLLCGLTKEAGAQAPPSVPGVTWPNRPAFDPGGYPTCQLEYVSKSTAFMKASAARTCRSALEQFNLSDLNGFVADATDYTQQLLRVDRSIRGGSYTYDVKVAAQAYVQRELAVFRPRRDSRDPGGQAWRTYYKFYMRYLADLAEQTRINQHYSPGWDR